MRGSSLLLRATSLAVAAVLGISGLAACDPGPDTQAPIHVNFAPTGQTPPTGYVNDSGEAYDAGRGYGWINQTDTTPLSIVGNARDRNKVTDQRLDTFIHMQFTGTGGVTQPARWEAAVANGIYDVTVAVGDVASVTGSTHRITVENTNLVNDFVPGSANRIATVTERIQVTDGKVTVDAAGGTNTKLDYIDVDPVSDVVGAGATIARINFAPASVPVPHRFKNDTGAAYTASRGYGWISQTAPTPLSIVGNGRDRNAADMPDQRLDTFMHMQFTGTDGVAQPARWQYALPMGTYDVTVSVGDATTPTGSTHRLAVEGTLAIDDFVASAANKFTSATVRVNVTDGLLTLDAAGGTNTKINYVQIIDADSDPRTITDVDPADGATDVPLDTAVALSPSHAVDQTTVNATTVKLLDPANVEVPGAYNSDAAGGVVIFTPTEDLTPNTTYTVQTTTGLHDTAGNAFAVFTSTFTTGTSSTPPAPVNFDKTVQADLTGPTSIVFGPDGKLYVGNGIGEIRRYTIGAGGALGASPEVFSPFGAFTRTITGLAFEPGSTATNLRLWVSHGELGNRDMANFTGKVSLLSGANLQTVQDKIIGLPRSVKDHMNNGVVFGPDGKLYLAQGSLSGYGAPDQAWGFRSETPMSGSILVADVVNDSRFAGTSSVNVNTSTGYDPTPVSAPVRVYAEGTRNPFDLVWHSNGSLYVPVNESAAGNTPAGPGGDPPALSGLPAGRDYLAKIQQGGYYGHPNPSQGHYVLNGGNPTAGVDPFETPQYPVGVQPDVEYQQPILDLGLHRSADGIDEYTSNVFGSTLRNKLLIAEYSNGDDIVAVNPNNTADKFQIATGLFNPLDVRADPTTGNVYVAEYGSDPDGAGGHITLLTPAPDSLRTPVAKINFQPQTSAVPSGYSKDYGQAYEAARGFGWVQPGTTTPVSLVGLGRERNLNADQRLDTFVHMQDTVTGPQGDWQVSVPDGSYDVTVAVGDAGNAVNSTHAVSAEGTVVIPPFTPTTSDKFRTATARVDVSDGFLTLSATGGTNTKIDYVDIDRITTSGPAPADTWNPKVELTTSGPGTPPNFTGPVTVTADTTDLGTGVASVTYSVDGAAAAPYTGAITVNSAGSHSVVVTAKDGAGNTGSATSNFTITPPSGSPAIKVTSAEDVLQLSSRLVFSTARGKVTPAKSATITNTGASDLVVSNITITGTNPNQFALASGQPKTFTVPPGGTATVSARFAATTSFGVKVATLNIMSNDPLVPTYTVSLRGVNAGGTVGNTEPNLSDLMTTLGYSTVTGITGTYQATTRAPVGDEVIAPYFKRVDTTKPVGLVPIARYVAATSFTSDTGYTPTKYSAARNVLYKFPADVVDDNPDDSVDTTQFIENQKVMPQIAPGGATSWTPSGVFGLAANYANYTDDQFNKDDTGTIFRNLRVFPAKGPGGVVIPNTWIVGVDIASSEKNFDYQDQVMLLTNATPELTAAAAPGSAATILPFDAPVSGTVLDKDGQGTGFNSVQPNTAGTQYKPNLIDLTSGTLRITSTVGKNSGATNTQDNALQVHFDASRSDFTVQGRILGPMSDLTAGFQQKSVFFGPDQQNYLKMEIEHRTDTPGVFLTVFKEEKGVTATIGQISVPSPASVSTLDFQITGDMETGTLQGAYRINSSGTWTNLGSAFVPANIFQWFSPQGRAGVLVSHTGSTTPITGVYDSFQVI